MSENIKEDIDIEYPDGSKFMGSLKEGENYELVIQKGVYRKKVKNNNSYFKRFEGQFKDGIPHGEDCLI